MGVLFSLKLTALIISIIMSNSVVVRSPSEVNPTSNPSILNIFQSANEDVIYSPSCIPYMSVGVIADPIGFLSRLFSTIDHCVINFVIVTHKDYQFTRNELEILKRSRSVRNITLALSPNKIVGVSEGWNIGLRLFHSSPWFLICAYDVEFLPGQLQKLNHNIWNDLNPSYANMFLVNWQNLQPGGYNLFAFDNFTFRELGYFDENFFPVVLFFYSIF